MWWKNAFLYQIYLPAFKDSNGDGIGDLPGLLSELGYLKDLGVDALYLTPFYPSPMVDNGYDISDYCAVDPRYGGLEDLDALIEALHQRGMFLVIDMVMNHSSIEHRWFSASRRQEAGYENRYIWRRKPVNNWESHFGGSAWSYRSERNGYYFHSFAEEMADLNWDDPDLINDFMKIFTFWLERGVDGFRLDVINFLKAGLDWNQDNPKKNGVQQHIHDLNGPGIRKILKQLRDLCSGYGEILLLGEVGSEKLEEIASYVGEPCLDAALNFNISSVRQLDWRALAQIIESHLQLYSDPSSQTSIFFSSHDMSRAFTRLCHENLEDAKALAAFILCVPGIAVLFQGEEFAMTDYKPEGPEGFFDTKARSIFQKALSQGIGRNEAFQEALAQSRDYSRPLLLGRKGSDPKASSDPLPPSPCDAEARRAAQARGPDSLISWIRQIRHLQEQSPDLIHGRYRLLESSKHHIVFSRQGDRDTWICALNTGPEKLLNRSYRYTRILSSSANTSGTTERGSLSSLPAQTSIMIARAKGGDLP